MYSCVTCATVLPESVLRLVTLAVDEVLYIPPRHLSHRLLVHLPPHENAASGKQGAVYCAPCEKDAKVQANPTVRVKQDGAAGVDDVI